MPHVTPGFNDRRSSHAAVSGFATCRTLPSTCSGGWMLPGDTALKARGFTWHMHIWYVRYSQTSHNPSSSSNQGAQAEWNKSTKSSHYTAPISGRNSGCIQGVLEPERKEEAEGQVHIQVSLLLQISLSWKTTSDLPTAATKNIPVAKPKLISLLMGEKKSK